MKKDLKRKHPDSFDEMATTAVEHHHHQHTVEAQLVNANDSQQIDVPEMITAEHLPMTVPQKPPKPARRIDMPEDPIQLPIRLRLDFKGEQFWCTLEQVSENQEVKTVYLERKNEPPQEFTSLSAAARSVTGLQTANGWRKWKYLYQNEWMPIGAFRKVVSKSSRVKENLKDPEIAPRGPGFVNSPNAASSLLAHWQVEKPEWKDDDTIKCMLSCGKKKKMMFLPFNMTVGQMLLSFTHDFGENLILELDEYEVDQNAKLHDIARPDPMNIGRHLVQGSVRELGKPIESGIEQNEAVQHPELPNVVSLIEQSGSQMTG